jgi:uncharacterized protein YbjQ (UPF0145 family)
MSTQVFTSDLTIDEVLLIEEVGFEPLELVMGSSYYHIGWSAAPWSTNQELGEISAVMRDARAVAMSRITDQAQSHGADGIVGMRIEMHREHHDTEFVAIGTAVRRRGGDGAAWRNQRYGLPFTCDLSGADFWALVRAGFRPISLAHGVCVYHVAHKTLGQWFDSIAQQSVNQEQVAFTQALYEARELAMGRMQSEAYEAGATAGVVAVDLRESNHGWDSHVLEMVAVGTGVARIEDASHETHEAPKAVIFAHDAEG